jgi:hypothetical protein
VATGAAVLCVAIVFPAVVAGASHAPHFVTQHPQSAATFRQATASTSASETAPDGVKCFGLYPATGAQSYQNDCYGHDEPALDPISSTPGSAQDVTWTIVLPKSTGHVPLLNLGPTFWIGATLHDPSSLADSVFSELQFYPDSTLLPQSGNDINTACTKFGFNVNPAKNVWSICDFSWGLYPSPQGFQETAAYVSVVDTTNNADQPLYLHSGDTIKVHIFDSGDANHDAEQDITDVTTGQTGTLIMNSDPTTGAGSVANPTTGDGPLTLPYSTNTTDNAMPWGVVLGTPFAISYEIGHSNFYTHPEQEECVPGQWDCQSYDTSSDGWLGVKPFQIKSVTFGVNGQQIAPDSWATNDGEGGTFEDDEWCGGFGPSQGTTTCGFPYYTYNPIDKAIDFGSSYPGTEFDYGQAPDQYTTEPTCPGPLTNQFGFDYYCDTTLSPSPPID